MNKIGKSIWSKSFTIRNVYFFKKILPLKRLKVSPKVSIVYKFRDSPSFIYNQSTHIGTVEIGTVFYFLCTQEFGNNKDLVYSYYLTPLILFYQLSSREKGYTKKICLEYMHNIFRVFPWQQNLLSTYQYKN